MGDTVWNGLGSKLDLLDFAELVGGFFFSDAVDGKSALYIVNKTKVLASLFNGNNI